MLIELSYLALLLYFVCLTSSMIIDKDWKLGKNYISDLGVSTSQPAKYLFNGGCVIFGALFVISMIEFILRPDLASSYYIILPLSMIMGVLLMLVGIVNENIMPLHKTVAMSYFVIRFILIAALIVFDVINADYLLAGVSAVVIAMTLVCAKKLEFPVTEVIWCYTLLAVVIVHFFLMV